VAVVPPVCLACFSAFGLYQRVWRFAGAEDLARCSLAATTGVGLSAVLSVLFNRMTPPLTWFATCYLLMLAGLNGSRASYRLLQDSWKRSRAEGEPVLIYGAGRLGTSAVSELLSRPDANMRPTAFIDDAPDMAGKVFNGYPVLGNVETLEAAISRYGAKGLIIATRNLPVERLRIAALSCERNGIWMRYFRVRFDDRGGLPEAPEAPASAVGATAR